MTLGYTTELTVEQYELLSPLLTPEGETGRPRTVKMMLVIQGIMYTHILHQNIGTIF